MCFCCVMLNNIFVIFELYMSFFFWVGMLMCIICDLCCNSSVFTFLNTTVFMVCCGEKKKKDFFTKILVPAISQE